MDSFEKTLMLGKIAGGRRRGQPQMRWHYQLNGHEFEQTPGDSEEQESLALMQSMRSQRVGHDLVTEQ